MRLDCLVSALGFAVAIAGPVPADAPHTAGKLPPAEALPWPEQRRRGKAAYDSGDYARAAALYEKALKQAEKEDGSDDTRHVELLDNAADAQRALEHTEAADALYRRVLAVHEAHGKDSVQVAQALEDIGQTWSTVDPNKAREPLERALKLFEAAPRADPGNRALALHNLAALDYADDHYAQAEARWQEALALRTELYGEKSSSVATTLYNLAMLADAQEQYAKGRGLFERALAAYEAAKGPDHPDVATCLVALADPDHCDSDGDACKTAAIPRLERATRIFERAFGPSHPGLHGARGQLAGDYEGLHRYADAIPLRLLLLRQTSDGDQQAYLHNALAEDYDATGDTAQAEVHRAEVRRLWPDEGDDADHDDD